jgi:RNA polymerase sigma-70 factor, ECF subfamily
MTNRTTDALLDNGREAPNAITDADVVVRVLAGDGPLYELIMRRYNRLLFRLARSIVHEDDEARDVVQAAYVRAYYHLNQFRGPAGFRAWLARIAINEAYARTRGAPTLVGDDHVLTLPDCDLAEPENAAMGGETLRILQIAIDRLPDEFRSVFMLRAVEQLSIAETAEVLDIKPATVKTRFHRARRLLQESLHRKLDDLARQTFQFDGHRCDGIVAAVLEHTNPTSTHDTGGAACLSKNSLPLA